MNGLVFNPTRLREKHQIRFWTTRENHKRFMSACKKEGLAAQNVFNDFINWFISESEKGTLPVKGDKNE